MFKHPWFWLLVLLVLIGLVTLLSPREQTLGANVRIVYLHGAWVLTAEVAFFAAALGGLAGLITRRGGLHRWSAALGRTGIVFWVTYLPLSVWAMETNWNGLFLSEPRFRLAAIFAVTGVLLQIGLAAINQRALTSAANVVFVIALRMAFSQAAYVMHPPPSPIFDSGNGQIIGFFITLNALTLLAAWQVARWFFDSSKA